MTEAGKIILHFIASVPLEDREAAREFLLAFYIGEGPTPTETASAAVRWARKTMDQRAAAQAVADQFAGRGLAHA